MNQHTQGPWNVSMNEIESATGELIATVIRDQDGHVKANARRIVACVNACEGIETGMLEGFSPGFLKSLPDRAYADRQHRDELLEALIAITDESVCTNSAIVEQARAAIAKAEGK